MAVHGDENGIIETCDDATANCEDCDWNDDGDGVGMIEAAQEHANETGHTVSISGTYYGTVDKDG